MSVMMDNGWITMILHVSRWLKETKDKIFHGTRYSSRSVKYFIIFIFEFKKRRHRKWHKNYDKMLGLKSNKNFETMLLNNLDFFISTHSGIPNDFEIILIYG